MRSTILTLAACPNMKKERRMSSILILVMGRVRRGVVVIRGMLHHSSKKATILSIYSMTLVVHRRRLRVSRLILVVVGISSSTSFQIWVVAPLRFNHSSLSHLADSTSASQFQHNHNNNQSSQS